MGSRADDSGTLGEVLGFTPDDVAANRAGRVTNRQLDAVTGLAQAEGRMGAGCGTLGLVLLIVSVFVIIPVATPAARPAVAVILGGAAGAVALWLALVVRRARRIVRPRLRMAEGPARCEVRHRGPREFDAGALEILLHVGDVAFRVFDQRVPAVVADGTPLRVWWLAGPTGPALVAAEPLDPDVGSDHGSR